MGKVDKHSLTDQTLMELFIDNVENPENIYGVCDSPPHLFKWRGCIETGEEDWQEWSLLFNSENNVTDIFFPSRDLRGGIQLEWMPESTTFCCLSHNTLSGSISLVSLPQSLSSLFLDNNAFCGTVNLTQLPGSLRALELGMNNLSGPVDLTWLPTVLPKLSLHENNFSGETDFNGLPKSLARLNVSGNRYLCGILLLQPWQEAYNCRLTGIKVYGSLD